MTTSIKKLLLISITLLLGVMSGGVMAQTNYDFTFTNDNYNDPGSVSGVFTVNSGASLGYTGSSSAQSYITGISGSITGTSVGSGTLNSINSAASGHNIFSYPTTPYVDAAKGVYFTTSIGNYELSYVSGSTYKLDGLSVSSGCKINGCTGILTVSPSVGAPEIDGSLAPKVGFLLGCLFLMFGRKKQHTGSTLA